MISRASLAILVICLVAAHAPVVAQIAGADVTFKVPLNLTKLSPDITKVSVRCRLDSTALVGVNGSGQQTHTLTVTTEVPVSNGQVVTTLTIVFSQFTLVNPTGVSASYGCNLTGTDKTGAVSSFTDSNPLPQFRVTPTPRDLAGTFTW